MVVVFPAPLGPRKPWIDPRVTFRLSLFTAASEPYFLVKLLVSIANSICGASIAVYRCGEHLSFDGFGFGDNNLVLLLTVGTFCALNFNLFLQFLVDF
jgi:hypothetical protein